MAPPSSLLAHLTQSLRGWRRKKTNGLADAAGLSSAEIAKRDLAAKGKAERAAIAAAQKENAGKPASLAAPATGLVESEGASVTMRKMQGCRHPLLLPRG